MGRSRSNRVERRVTLMFSDPNHCIHLVEHKAKVRFELGVDRTLAFGDLDDIDNKARQEMAARELLQGVDLDLVGVLCAVNTKGEEDRIVWMEKCEVMIAERKLAEAKNSVTS